MPHVKFKSHLTSKNHILGLQFVITQEEARKCIHPSLLSMRLEYICHGSSGLFQMGNLCVVALLIARVGLFVMKVLATWLQSSLLHPELA